MRFKKIKQHTILIGLTLLVCSFLFVAGVAATTTPTLAHKTQISFGFTNFYDDTYDRLWVSDDGILHIRGGGHFGDVWGDLIGTLTYDGDINLNMETYDGTGVGLVCFSVNYGDLSGTFEGKMVLKVNSGYITGMFVCHGDGDFEGMKLKGTCEGDLVSKTYSADAIILNPHG